MIRPATLGVYGHLDLHGDRSRQRACPSPGRPSISSPKYARHSTVGFWRATSGSVRRSRTPETLPPTRRPGPESRTAEGGPGAIRGPSRRHRPPRSVHVTPWHSHALRSCSTPCDPKIACTVPETGSRCMAIDTLVPGNGWALKAIYFARERAHTQQEVVAVHRDRPLAHPRLEPVAFLQLRRLRASRARTRASIAASAGPEALPHIERALPDRVSSSTPLGDSSRAP